MSNLENALARSYSEGHACSERSDPSAPTCEAHAHTVERRSPRPTLPVYRVECLAMVDGAPSSTFCVAAATAADALAILEDEHPRAVVDRLERLERVILPPAPPAPPPVMPSELWALVRSSGPEETKGGVIALVAAREDLVCWIAEEEREAFLDGQTRRYWSLAGESGSSTGSDGKPFTYRIYAGVERVRTGVEHSPAAQARVPCPMGIEGCELPHAEPEAERTIPPGAAVVDASTVDRFREALSARAPRPSPEIQPQNVSGRVKYVRMANGEIRFAHAGLTSHSEVVKLPERYQVVSAGRVDVDRDEQTVTLYDAGSLTIGVESAPDDCAVIEAFLFGAST